MIKKPTRPKGQAAECNFREVFLRRATPRRVLRELSSCIQHCYGPPVPISWRVRSDTCTQLKSVVGASQRPNNQLIARTNGDIERPAWSAAVERRTSVSVTLAIVSTTSIHLIAKKMRRIIQPLGSERSVPLSTDGFESRSATLDSTHRSSSACAGPRWEGELRRLVCMIVCMKQYNEPVDTASAYARSASIYTVFNGSLSMQRWPVSMTAVRTRGSSLSFS